MRVRTIIAMIGVFFCSVSLGETALVNTPGDGFLALRSEPSARHGVRLSKIPHAAPLVLSECVSSSPTERWCKTTHQGKTGWVLANYLNRSSKSPDNGPAVANGRQTSSSSEESAILKAVAKECAPNWCTAAVATILDGYATVDFICKKKDCENCTAYLKKTGSEWIMVDQGTGITPDDLVSHGFPPNVARALAQ